MLSSAIWLNVGQYRKIALCHYNVHNDFITNRTQHAPTIDWYLYIVLIFFFFLSFCFNTKYRQFRRVMKTKKKQLTQRSHTQRQTKQKLFLLIWRRTYNYSHCAHMSSMRPVHIHMTNTQRNSHTHTHAHDDTQFRLKCNTDRTYESYTRERHCLFCWLTWFSCQTAICIYIYD